MLSIGNFRIALRRRLYFSWVQSVLTRIEDHQSLFARAVTSCLHSSDVRYRSQQSKSYFLIRVLKFSQHADILGGVQIDSPYKGTFLFNFFLSFFQSRKEM